MKYFNPTYWFKLWVLSAPLFNSKSEGIYAKSIDNQKIKDWASKNTNSLESINQEISYTNSSNNYQSYNLNQTNQNINPIYQTDLDSISSQELETSTHKHRHEKSRKRVKRKDDENKKITVSNLILFRYLPNDPRYTEWYSFRTQILFILSDLENENLISRISFDENLISRIPIYSINSNNNNDDIFIIPIRLNDSPSYSQTIDKFTCVNNPWIRGQYENTSDNDLRLVFRARDFYLQGFIANNNYYYFSDSTTIQYENTNSINLGYSSNYNVLAGDIDTISWENIYNSFNTLQSYNRRYDHNSIRKDLVRVILATAESMRFYGISNKINEIYTNSQTISWQSLTSLTQNWLNISNNVNSWLLLFLTTLANNQELLQNIATLMAIVDNVKCKHKNAKKQKRNINMCFNSSNKNILVCDLKPQIDKIKGDITIIKVLDEKNKGIDLKSGDIYVGTTNALYLIGANSIVYQFNNISDEITNIINFNNNYYVNTKKEEIYFLNTSNISKDGTVTGEKIKTDNITLEEFSNLITVIKKSDYSWFGIIKVIKKLPRNSKDNNLKTGDMYIATDKGIFVFYSKKQQINHYDELGNINIIDINFINNFNDGIAYVIDDKCEVYYFEGWYPKKINNIKSCDLNKELRLYYNEDKSEKQQKYGWGNNEYCEKLIKTWNLSNINPIDNFKKIEFLGDVGNSRISWANVPYYGDFNLDHWNGEKLGDLIFNIKYDNMNNIRNYCKFKLQPYDTKWDFLGWAAIFQCVAIAWYWKDYNYYLQVMTSQYGHTSGTTYGAAFINLGNGIRLYNDDDKFETQIPNPNDRKRREIFEEKNITKWTDEFTKSIKGE